MNFSPEKEGPPESILIQRDKNDGVNKKLFSDAAAQEVFDNFYRHSGSYLI